MSPITEAKNLNDFYEFHKSVHGGLRLAVLNEAHNGVDDNNYENDQHVRKISEREVCAALHDRHNGLNCGCDEEHDDHGVCEGVDKLLKEAVFFRLFKLVLAVFGKALLRFGRGQAFFGALDRRENLLCRLKIEFHALSRPFFLI